MLKLSKFTKLSHYMVDHVHQHLLPNGKHKEESAKVTSNDTHKLVHLNMLQLANK